MPRISPVIVITDSDKDYLQLMQELLSEHDYEVIISDSGAKAYGLFVRNMRTWRFWMSLLRRLTPSLRL